MFTRPLGCLVFVAVALSGAAAAVAQRAHVHGEAELNLVAEADALYLELIMPADSLVGFERAPRSDAEYAALAEARARLGDVVSLFQVVPECEVVAVELNDPFASGKDDVAHAAHAHAHAHAAHAHADHAHTDHHHDHGHHHHGDHGHGDHGHGDHDHGDHDHDHGSHDHADFVMLVSYACAQSPTGLEVALFEAFPRLERVRTQYVSPGGQGAAVLSANRPGVRW